MFLYDFTYILLIPAVLLALFAQMRVSSNYGKYSQIRARNGITGARMAEEIRETVPGALIIAVHTTGISREEAARVVEVADIVTACASGTIREAARARALVQGGTGVPVYALTPRGKALVMAKLSATTVPLLVKGGPLPEDPGRAPAPLV